MGPVQVLVVGFHQPSFDGEVLAELTRLRDAGIVRLLDLLLVTRADDGAIETIELPDAVAAGMGRVAAALLGQGDEVASAAPQPGQGGPATWSLADAVPLGSTAAVALIEHTWAIPLRDAIVNAGGTAFDETWLSGEDLALLDSLLDAE